MPAGWRIDGVRPPVPGGRPGGSGGPRDLFGRTTEGRRFDNGIALRQARYFEDAHYRRYFPHGYSYYPYYCPTFEFGVVYYSPYSYYVGTVPLYIYRHHCHVMAPPVVYISIPIYRDSYWSGWADDGDYYLYDDGYRYDSAYREGGLNSAIDAIEDAFRHDDVVPLVDLTDPSVDISVFRRGKYEYSMEAGDYLDMTRDAMRAIQTVSFKIERVRRRSDDVWSLAGRHVYKDNDGDRRTVYVSYVLERIHGRWTITQVGTTPDRLN